jgi:hypothetical protein
MKQRCAACARKELRAVVGPANVATDELDRVAQCAQGFGVFARQRQRAHGPETRYALERARIETSGKRLHQATTEPAGRAGDDGRRLPNDHIRAQLSGKTREFHFG